MKTERIGLTVTKQDKELIFALARIEGGLSLASLIRRLIRKAAERHHLIERGSRERRPDEVRDDQRAGQGNSSSREARHGPQPNP